MSQTSPATAAVQQGFGEIPALKRRRRDSSLSPMAFCVCVLIARVRDRQNRILAGRVAKKVMPIYAYSGDGGVSPFHLCMRKVSTEHDYGSLESGRECWSKRNSKRLWSLRYRSRVIRGSPLCRAASQQDAVPELVQLQVWSLMHYSVCTTRDMGYRCPADWQLS